MPNCSLLNVPTVVGLSYSDYVRGAVVDAPALIDYVEIPFEHLAADPSAIDLLEHVPVILHCASLSLAGDAEPEAELIKQLKHWIKTSNTPWLGEHIAYIRTDGKWRELAEHAALVRETVPVCSTDALVQSKSTLPGYAVGYTVSPQLSSPILDRMLATSQRWANELELPVLLENGPIYFNMPGSTMSQISFIGNLCHRSASTRLLLDLSHLAITCSNLGWDPFKTLEELPLERVVEVHLSGAKKDKGVVWDDHSAPAPDIVFELLEHLLRRCTPRAITLEYNWDQRFPRDIVERDVTRTRKLLSDTQVVAC